VLGAAYVFPGGKVDPADIGLADRLDQPSSILSGSLGEPDLTDAHVAALYVAAIREAFEEAGVLFAAIQPEILREALELHQSGRPFETIVRALAAPLAASALLPRARWLTPLASVRP
jgi:8-oxo-dGTP pyrophosphatase MutT (NUDIX family)